MEIILGLTISLIMCLVLGAVNGRNISEMLKIAIRVYLMCLLISGVVIAPLAVYVYTR
ncbi:hypothetical protein BUBS_3 [Bacillus phage Bubs]|uniref:Uncharacterized protein n=4 Tax=Wphvirus megatron TaxID=1987728 RepID=A0A173H2D0_9CAUD|nr:hypothetical protein QLX47_gp004 [Bacillus phage Eyuki]YP_009280377.1 hypothetical protein BI039_gp003 [Bacillus phage Belinda]YP_009280806.1 hypothetical protein SAGEFAYGE_3 [Bacillus phage SageFayge]YP_009284945.1 hypothetical protein BIZ88_gp003 [Bacillus phage DirtyBetty]ANI24622.1 hypothetical protein SMUDGE_3 [Bacillus phage Smudge]ASR78485.1 hypothetical protein BUBS_3 [Bacillus phage Bubs]ALA46562.1 hypothetical protein EYUKI_4 [Bacillus phage Eyuki]AMW62924.1 hypothetical protein